MNLLASVKERASSLPGSIHTWFARQLGDQKPKGTIAALDGVRAVACIMVLMYHTSSVFGKWDTRAVPFFGVLVNFGAKGVTLFFVLSGFLLFLPYVQALLFEKRWPQARTFYLRRILRIIPGYYFSLFAVFLFTKTYFLQVHNWKTDFFFLTFLMTPLQSAGVNGAYWTLAVEFQYYIILPLIALGMYALTRLVPQKLRLWVVIASLLVMVGWGLATRRWGQALFARPDYQTFIATHTITRYIAELIYGTYTPFINNWGKFLEDFAVGMLLALCYIVVTKSPRESTYRRILLRLSPWLWWLGIVLLAFAAWRIAIFALSWPPSNTIFDIYPSWAAEFLCALGFGCCILAILFNGSGVLKRFFEWTPLRWVGLISFSLYLWNEPLIIAIENNIAPSLFKSFSFPLALVLFDIIVGVVVTSVAFVLYVLVEKPGMRLSERLRTNNLERAEQKELVHSPNLTFQSVDLNPGQKEPVRSPGLAFQSVDLDPGQKELVHSPNLTFQSVDLDLEKTEPRQAVVLPEASHP